ncbi:hypothetical protein ACU4GD_42590 [Cupriavidus basilensis]
MLSLLPVLPLVGLGACSTSDVLNGLTQSRAYALTASVPYADGARGKLDIYAPREPACSGEGAGGGVLLRRHLEQRRSRPTTPSRRGSPWPRAAS